MSLSCHGVEIVIKLGIFIFFSLSAEKSCKPNFAFLDPNLQAIKVPQLKKDKASKLNKIELYSF